MPWRGSLRRPVCRTRVPRLPQPQSQPAKSGNHQKRRNPDHPPPQPWSRRSRNCPRRFHGRGRPCRTRRGFHRSGSGRGRPRGNLRLLRLALHIAYEPVPAPRNRLDPVKRVLLVDGLPELGDMNRQVRLLDKRVGPNPPHQLFFFHQLPMLLHQHKQDINRFSRKGNQLSFPKKEVLRGVQPERSEHPLRILRSIHGPAVCF